MNVFVAWIFNMIKTAALNGQCRHISSLLSYGIIITCIYVYTCAHTHKISFFHYICKNSLWLDYTNLVILQVLCLENSKAIRNLF